MRRIFIYRVPGAVHQRLWMEVVPFGDGFGSKMLPRLHNGRKRILAAFGVYADW